MRYVTDHADIRRMCVETVLGNMGVSGAAAWYIAARILYFGYFAIFSPILPLAERHTSHVRVLIAIMCARGCLFVGLGSTIGRSIFLLWPRIERHPPDQLADMGPAILCPTRIANFPRGNGVFYLTSVLSTHAGSRRRVIMEDEIR
jgi:uncharacterized membrane protein YtjA (UPF0391 family)